MGTTPGGVDVVPPMADPITGYRYIRARGNAEASLTRTLKNLEPAKQYFWSVQTIDNSFEGSVWSPERSFVHLVSTDKEDERPGSTFSLSQNYPNPFKDNTTLQFTLPEATQVDLVVYDATGKKVAVLKQGVVPAGDHLVEWKSNGFASGVYLVRLQAGQFSQSTRMMLIR